MPVTRFDRGNFRQAVSETPEGWLRGDAVVSRIGVLHYRLPNGSVRRELRHPDDVFAADSLATLRTVPVTNDHPPTLLLTKDSAKKFAVGTTGDNIRPDGRYIVASLAITDKEAIQAIHDGKRELSLGYISELVEEKGVYDGEEYDYRQTNIRYNHLAIVDRARAGSMARLNLDAADAVEINHEEKTMPKVTLDGIDYEAAPEVINALARARTDAATAKSEAETHKTDAQKAKATAEALQAKLDSAEAALKTEKEKDHSATIAAAVKERVNLLAVAGKAKLSAEVAAKLDSMSDMEIRKAVITAAQPTANLDGKGDVYITARFDSVVETLGDVSNQRSAVVGDPKKSHTNTNNDSADSARARMIQGQTSAWKREETK